MYYLYVSCDCCVFLYFLLNSVLFAPIVYNSFIWISECVWFLLEASILTITIFKVPEAQRKTAREERISVAVQKRKVSPPPEGSAARGLIYEQIVLM